MTLQELFASVSEHPQPVVIFFLMLPLTAFIVGVMSDKEERYNSPWKYLYAALVYLSSVPGILALVLCVYTLFFERSSSILEVNILVYFLPILIMIATLIIISNKVNMRRIPGFQRLSGLLLMLGVTFISILIIQKTRIWVIFHGSITYLIGLFVVLFVVFYLGWIKLFAPNTQQDNTRNIDIY